jgi:hypothetical protein
MSPKQTLGMSASGHVADVRSRPKADVGPGLSGRLLQERLARRDSNVRWAHSVDLG